MLSNVCNITWESSTRLKFYPRECMQLTDCLVQWLKSVCVCICVHLMQWTLKMLWRKLMRGKQSHSDDEWWDSAWCVFSTDLVPAHPGWPGGRTDLVLAHPGWPGRRTDLVPAHPGWLQEGLIWCRLTRDDLAGRAFKFAVQWVQSTDKYFARNISRGCSMLQS